MDDVRKLRPAFSRAFPSLSSRVPPTSATDRVAVSVPVRSRFFFCPRRHSPPW
ncbi:hypothetical protein BN903_43 [Halorubrum sp. AJ67]|nr:hypothetical protein BN903_43 [Halorubrum sp. AJ67]